MASWETLLAFASAMVVFAYVPGPAVIYAAAQTIARGQRAGYLAALGIHLGGYFHVLVVTLGLSAVLAYTPAVYAAIKFVGACYLVWMGIALLAARDRPKDSAVPARKSGKRAFIDSIIVEVLNPKTALFFLAFLPQFADPSGSWPVSIQLLTLGIVANIVFSSADITAVALASSVLDRLRNARRTAVIFRWIGGSLLIGLGMKLALEDSL